MSVTEPFCASAEEGSLVPESLALESKETKRAVATLQDIPPFIQSRKGTEVWSRV